MSVYLFQVNLRASGDIFHVAAQGFHFADDNAKFAKVRERPARVVVWDGLVEFFYNGTSTETPSPQHPSGSENPCFIPNYYYIPADEVSAIIPMDQATFGVVYSADFPPATAPTVDPDRYYGWVIYLNAQGIGPEEYGSPYGSFRKHQLWLAKKFDFRDKTEADQYVRVRQAKTQLVLNFVGSVGPLATLNEPAEYYPDLDRQYYVPLSSIAAVFPVTGPIHTITPV